MSEDLIVQQCSPTLAGLKTGSLFTCPFRTEEELRADIAALNRRLAPKGVNVRILRIRKRALLYLYRPSSLRRDFATAEVAMLLRQYGYTVDDADACIEVGKFAHTARDDIPLVGGRCEYGLVRPELLAGAALFGGSNDLDRIERLALFVFLLIDVAVAVDLRKHVGRQGVHAAHADTVESA